jgi:hypothetical protein
VTTITPQDSLRLTVYVPKFVPSDTVASMRLPACAITLLVLSAGCAPARPKPADQLVIPIEPILVPKPIVVPVPVVPALPPPVPLVVHP